MEVEGCFLRLFTEILFGPLFRYRMRTKTFKNSIEDRFVSQTLKLHRSNHRSSISIKSSKLHLDQIIEAPPIKYFRRLRTTTRQRAPKPNPPSQPRPRTRRAYHLAHAKGRRIDRHQRLPARRLWRDVRHTRTLRAPVPGH